MSERNWTKASMLGYIYIAMAGATDDELSEAEKRQIGASVSEWFPNDSSDAIVEEIVKAHDWFVEDYTNKGIEVVAQNVTELAEMCKHNIKQDSLISVLKDLVKIAIADNNLMENERIWINTIAEIFEVNFHV
jgi:uncharacterized tellurite resistance protein B-like protein